ncbi:MAG: flagellar hook-associated protein FlgL, partial [Halomonas sp.]
MRISSVTMFDQSTASMNRQQSDFLKVSQQIASGRRVVNPSDDPQAASRAVGVDQAKAVTEQYGDARTSARNSLAQTESILNSTSDAITSAKTLLVQASSDTLSNVDRESIASELKGVYETMLGQANATDGNGRFLFGGYNDSNPPFVKQGDAVEYRGDQNTREQRVDASRLM